MSLFIILYRSSRRLIWRSEEREISRYLCYRARATRNSSDFHARSGPLGFVRGMAAAIGWGCVRGPLYASNNNNNSNHRNEEGYSRRPPTRCSGNGSQRRIASVKRSPNVVFRDDMKGIVCYTNENGEIVCEGPDEGPHFHPNISKRQSMPGQLYSFLQASHFRPCLLLEGLDFK